MEKLSPSLENYLKTIYSLCRHNTTVRVSDIATQMGLSKASVCRATNILSVKGLVYKNKYHSLSLTEEGIQEAQLISNKFKIIETFLHQILGIHPSIAEKDAFYFQHNISLESLQSMNQFLLDSKLDPQKQLLPQWEGFRR